MYVDIYDEDAKKLFAISEELCYNIKRVKNVGILSPLHFFRKHVGTLIGALFFIVFSVLSNNYVFNIVFKGPDGAEDQNVKALLVENGIKPFCRFSSFDLKKLSSKLLMKSDNLVYVGASRKGNTLILEIIKNSDIIVKKDSNVKRIVSDVNGVVRDIKVYRGTAIKTAGDTVKVGDVLVDGYDTVRDNKIEVNVVASVAIFYEKRFDVLLPEDSLEDVAEAIVCASFDEGEIASTRVVKGKIKNGYNYSVYIGKIRVITN